MLGGGTRGAAEFAPHAHALASSFRVIRPQALNIERSEKHQPLPPGYSVKMESAAVARSIDRLGTTAAFDLVGHSLGALVALDFALDHPDRVRTLILAEPPAPAIAWGTTGRSNCEREARKNTLANARQKMVLTKGSTLNIHFPQR